MKDLTMTATSSDLVELCQASDEFEARMILGLLEDHGIEAATTGEFTAGFRAEAPGVVRVYVGKSNLEMAAALVAEARSKSEVGEATDSDQEEEIPRTFSLFPQSLLILAIELAVVAILAWQFWWD